MSRADTPPFSPGDAIHVTCGGPWKPLHGRNLQATACVKASTYPGGWAVSVAGPPGLTLPAEMVGSMFVKRTAVAPDPLASCCVRARATLKALTRSGLRQLAMDVCDRHGVGAAEMLGRDRTRRIVAARDELLWEIRARQYSSPAIADMFGLNHTNVLDAAKRHERRLAQTPPGRAA